MAITNTTTSEQLTEQQPFRTQDSFDASCIIAGGHAALQAIEGELGHKTFVFDRRSQAR
jgi:hypothetical protein